MKSSGRGGRRLGAGRKVGSATKRTRAIANAAAESGLTPLDFMLERMRDPCEDDRVRREMAVAAAPYLHPRLAATTIRADINTPLMLGIASAEELRAHVRGQTILPSDPKHQSVCLPPLDIQTKSATNSLTDRLEGFRDREGVLLEHDS